MDKEKIHFAWSALNSVAIAVMYVKFKSFASGMDEKLTDIFDMMDELSQKVSENETEISEAPTRAMVEEFVNEVQKMIIPMRKELNSIDMNDISYDVKNMEHITQNMFDDIEAIKSILRKDGHEEELRPKYTRPRPSKKRKKKKRRPKYNSTSEEESTEDYDYISKTLKNRY